MLEQSDCVELSTDSVQVHSVHRDWVLPFSVNGSIVPIKLDTGAQVCTMGENTYHSLLRANSEVVVSHSEGKFTSTP